MLNRIVIAVFAIAGILAAFFLIRAGDKTARFTHEDRPSDDVVQVASESSHVDPGIVTDTSSRLGPRSSAEIEAAGRVLIAGIADGTGVSGTLRVQVVYTNAQNAEAKTLDVPIRDGHWQFALDSAPFLARILAVEIEDDVAEVLDPAIFSEVDLPVTITVTVPETARLEVLDAESGQRVVGSIWARPFGNFEAALRNPPRWNFLTTAPGGVEGDRPLASSAPSPITLPPLQSSERWIVASPGYIQSVAPLPRADGSATVRLHRGSTLRITSDIADELDVRLIFPEVSGFADEPPAEYTVGSATVRPDTPVSFTGLAAGRYAVRWRPAGDSGTGWSRGSTEIASDRDNHFALPGRRPSLTGTLTAKGYPLGEVSMTVAPSAVLAQASSVALESRSSDAGVWTFGPIALDPGEYVLSVAPFGAAFPVSIGVVDAHVDWVVPASEPRTIVFLDVETGSPVEVQHMAISMTPSTATGSARGSSTPLVVTKLFTTAEVSLVPGTASYVIFTKSHGPRHGAFVVEPARSYYQEWLGPLVWVDIGVLWRGSKIDPPDSWFETVTLLADDGVPVPSVNRSTTWRRVYGAGDGTVNVDPHAPRTRVLRLGIPGPAGSWRVTAKGIPGLGDPDPVYIAVDDDGRHYADFVIN